MTPIDPQTTLAPQPILHSAQPEELLVPTGPADILTLQAEVRASVGLSAGDLRAGAVGLQAGIRPTPVLDPLRSHLRAVDPGTFGAFVRWPISVRTLGADRGFHFETAEVTPHGVYVHCEDFLRTPFRAGATIVQAILHVPRMLVRGEGTPADFDAFAFLAKITAAMDTKAAMDAFPQVPGFVLQVIQIDFEKSALLANTLARLRAQSESGAS